MLNNFRGLAVPANLSRSEWVDVQLTRVFAQDAMIALYTTMAVSLVVAGLLYTNIPIWQIGLWVFAQLAAASARFWALRLFFRHQRESITGTDASKALTFKYEWLWPLSAFIWGSSAWLFFLRASTFDQFICMLILVGLASMSVITFGANLQCALRFVDTLHVSIAFALVTRLLTTTKGLPSSTEIAWVAVLSVVYWGMVRAGVYRFNKIVRNGFKVQFDNTVLITSLTEKSRSALQAVSTKDRFIASAAHDLRQPVHALNLYAGWLADDPHLVEQITPKIVRSTQVLNELFDSLFYFSGLNTEPLQVKPQQVNLQQLLEDMKYQFEAVAVERDLDLQVRCEPGTLWTDPMLIKRLLGNYLTNAFKHTHKGSVALSANWHKGMWRIEVADTGPGIAEDQQKAIFEEFYRAPSLGTEEGFGLGLAIVVRLSKALGHRIGLRSTVGTGSVFWVDVNAANPTSI